MSPRRDPNRAWLFAAPLILTLLTVALLASPALGQDATLTPAQAAPVTETPAASVTPGTPTSTSTPTLTPTATPTLTELQSRLVLAQTYLAGKDYEQAATLFAAIAEEDRGNAEALAGLQAALDGKAMQLATLIAPPPTVEATAAPAPAPTPAPTLRDAISAKLREFLGTAFAALAVVVSIYLLANAIRWLLQVLREAWYLRVLPLLKRPAIAPGYLIGEFTNGLGDTGANAVRLVPLAMTEKLLAWNQLIQAKEVPVEPEPQLDLGGMSWLKVLWAWILPAPRGYRVSGMLSLSNEGAYQLAVQRTSLARNSIDRSATFEKPGFSPDSAFRALAGEAAKWLVNPADIEASQAIVRGLRSVKGAEEAMQLTPSEVFDQALELLLPVRQQVTAGAIDYADARGRLRSAESLLAQLPSGSGLRQELQAVVTDLRRSVPAG